MTGNVARSSPPGSGKFALSHRGVPSRTISHAAQPFWRIAANFVLSGTRLGASSLADLVGSQRLQIRSKLSYS
jgi:hypothetical protein